MFCPNCGAKIEDNARFCTECGSPIQSVPSSAQPTQNSQTPVFTTVPRQQAPQNTSETNVYGNVWTAPATTPPKKRGKTALWIILAAVVVIAAVAALNYKVISASVRNLFVKPVGYYQQVETKELEKFADDLASSYQKSLAAPLQRGDFGAQAEVTLRLGSSGKSLISEAMNGMDLSWLESVGFSSDVTRRSNDTGMNGNVQLNGKTLFTFEMLMDSTGLSYCLVPELADSWFFIDPADYATNVGGFGMRSPLESVGKLPEAMATLGEALPDSATLKSLIMKYGEIVINGIHTVERANGTLGVFDVEAKGSMLSIVVTEQELRDIVSAVCTALRDDQEIRSCLKNMEKTMERSDLYNEFIDQVERTLEDLDEITMDGDLRMTLWVIKDGEIMGRQIDVNGTGIRMEAPRDGDRFALLVNLYEDAEQPYSLTGSGTIVDGLMKGSFTLAVDGTDYILADVDRMDLDGFKAGKTDIKLSLRPTRDLLDTMGMEGGTAALVSAMNIRLELSGDYKNGSSLLDLRSGNDSLISAEIKMGEKRAAPLPTPDGAQSLEAWTQENSSILMYNLYDILQNSDIPMSLLSGLFG